MRGTVAKRLRRQAEKLSINDRKSFKNHYKHLKADFNRRHREEQ